MAKDTIYKSKNDDSSVVIPLDFKLSFHENNKDSALQDAINNIIEAATALSAKDEEKDAIKNGILSTSIDPSVTPSDFNKPGDEYKIGHVSFSVPYFEALQYDFGSNVIDISLYIPDISIGKTD